MTSPSNPAATILGILAIAFFIVAAIALSFQALTARCPACGSQDIQPRDCTHYRCNACGGGWER